MAKNYTISEAVQIIAEGQDLESINDLGKRYPILTHLITKVAAKACKEFVEFMNYMPEYISANKINSAIKKALAEAEDADDSDDEDVEEKPVKKASKAGRPKKAVEEDDEDEDEDEDEATDGSYDYDSMNNAKMYKLLGDLGKRKDCKAKYGDLSHDSMLKYLKKYGPKAGDTSDVDDVEDEETGDEYEGKSAVELYKLCKQRKIKAEQKKPAKYYIGLLKEADKEVEAEEDTDAEDDEWDDDEEEEAPKKKAPAKKAPVKKAPAKKAKKEEPEDDDDDDDEWEI